MVIPVKEMNIPRLCTLGGKLRAKKTEIPVLNADDLALDEDLTGLKGSATLVVNVTYPQMTREGRKILSSAGTKDAVKLVVDLLEEKIVWRQQDERHETKKSGHWRKSGVKPYIRYRRELLAWGRELADPMRVPLASILVGSGVAPRAEELIAAGADKVYSRRSFV